MLTSLPLEGRHAIDIDEQDGRRDHIPEQRLHPRADLQAPAGVGLQQEAVPSPAELVAAEQGKHQGSQGQNIVGHQEIPQVQPGSALRKGLEVLNFSENCIKSETMLAFLAEEQIYVSSASACGRGQPSHTLAAMGRSPLAIDTAIRVSFCADNTPEDVDAFLNRFEDGMKHLQRIRR